MDMHVCDVMNDAQRTTDGDIYTMDTQHIIINIIYS